MNHLNAVCEIWSQIVCKHTLKLHMTWDPHSFGILCSVEW